MKLNHPFIGGKNSTEQRRKLCLFPYTNKIMGMTNQFIGTVWAKNHLSAYFLHGISGPHTLSILTYIHTSKCHKRSKIIHQKAQETLCHKPWKLPPSKAVLGEGQNSTKCFQCILLPGKQREEPSTISIHKHLKLYQKVSFQPKDTF